MQSVVKEKSAACGPVSDALIAAGKVPLLVTVMLCDVDCVPRFTLPNERLVGVADR